MIALILWSSMAFADPPVPAEAPKAEAPKVEVKVPRLSKTAIGSCGCSIYAPEGVKIDEPVKWPDGSDVYTIDTVVGNHHFSAIAVKFVDGMPTDGDELEALLVNYLEYLKSTLGITQSAGVGKGHTMTSNPKARGVIDFWKDKDGDEWKVKAWVDPKHIGVMFVYGKGDYPIYNLEQMYLDGFRFE